MSRTHLKHEKKVLKLTQYLGLLVAILIEFQKSDPKVIFSTIKEDLRVLNPHRSHRRIELEKSNYFQKTIDEIESLLYLPFHSLSEFISPRCLD